MEKKNEKWPRQGEYTLDDYYALPDDVRVELIAALQNRVIHRYRVDTL